MMIAFICSTIESPDDRAFMTALYQDYERLMFSTARAYTSHLSDQQDIVQDALEKLIKKISDIRAFPRCILASYIVSTIRNTAINHLKRQSRIHGKVCSLEEDAYFELEAPAPPPDDLLTLAESLAELWSGLSDEDRILLEGKYILDATDEELASQLTCKVSSIRMKLTRARRRAFVRLSERKEV